MKNLFKNKWCSWSAAKKGVVLFAFMAVLITFCTQIIMIKTQFANTPDGKSLNYLVGVTVGIPVNLPTGLIEYFTGSKLPENTTASGICLMAVVNAIVYGGIGGIVWFVGHLLAQQFRKLKKNST